MIFSFQVRILLVFGSAAHSLAARTQVFLLPVSEAHVKRCLRETGEMFSAWG